MVDCIVLQYYWAEEAITCPISDTVGFVYQLEKKKRGYEKIESRMRTFTFTTILKDCVGLIEWAIEDDDVILVGTFNIAFLLFVTGNKLPCYSTVVLLPPTIHK